MKTIPRAFFAVVSFLSLINFSPAFGQDADPIEVDAKEIAAAFEADAKAADAKYKGKLLLVNGKIESFGDLNGEAYITLATDEPIIVVQCMGATVEGAKEGKKVTIKGRCDGGSGNVLLRECALQ